MKIGQIRPKGPKQVLWVFLAPVRGDQGLIASWYIKNVKSIIFTILTEWKAGPEADEGCRGVGQGRGDPRVCHRRGGVEPYAALGIKQVKLIIYLLKFQFTYTGLIQFEGRAVLGQSWLS